MTRPARRLRTDPPTSVGTRRAHLHSAEPFSAIGSVGLQFYIHVAHGTVQSMHFAELIPTPLGPSGETPIELYQAYREINQQITPLHTGEGHAQTGTAKSTGVAEYFVERLAAEGISHCFGVAGDYVFPICDAVESSAKVKWVG